MKLYPEELFSIGALALCILALWLFPETAVNCVLMLVRIA